MGKYHFFTTFYSCNNYNRAMTSYLDITLQEMTANMSSVASNTSSVRKKKIEKENSWFLCLDILVHINPKVKKKLNIYCWNQHMYKTLTFPEITSLCFWETKNQSKDNALRKELNDTSAPKPAIAFSTWTVVTTVAPWFYPLPGISLLGASSWLI